MLYDILNEKCIRVREKMARKLSKNRSLKDLAITLFGSFFLFFIFFSLIKLFISDATILSSHLMIAGMALIIAIILQLSPCYS